MSARWGSVRWGTTRWAQRNIAPTGTTCLISDSELTVCSVASKTLGGETNVANEYTIGNIIRIDATFKNNGVLVNPTTVTGRIKTPSGVYSTFTVDDALIQSSTGIYYFTYQPTEEGRHEYRITGTGANVSAAEGHFTIVESYFN